MTGPFYAAVDDPYCYRGTNVLKNRARLRDQAALERFESAMTALRFDEPMPNGAHRVRHYRAVHRHIFQDVYTWAGRYRSVRIGKGDSMFCYPENISTEIKRAFDGLQDMKFLRGLLPDDYARGAAAFLTTLNAIHPFRDGNGRAQVAFLALLTRRAGYALDLSRMDPEAFLAAMIAGFYGDEAPLCAQIRRLI